MSNARQLAANLPREGGLSNRNMVINGGFDVWQRGTPTTSASGGSYFSADRWKGYAGSTRTFTRDETSALSIGFKNCIKAEVGTANASFYQRIEDVRTLAGKTVTLSYYIKADTAHTPTATYLTQHFGSGGSSDVNVNLPAPTITTDWQRVEQTVTLPSVEGKTIGTSSYLLVYPFTMTASRTYYITGVQLEVGSSATPFEHRSISDELQRCQRYFFSLKSAQYQYDGSDRKHWNFSPEMRVTPTITTTTGSATVNRAREQFVTFNGYTGEIRFDADAEL